MESQLQIELLIGIGVFAMFSLVLLIAVFTLIYKRKILERENALRNLESEKKVQLFKAAVEAEENLKARIASGLHDQIIPGVTTSIMMIDDFFNVHKGKYPPVEQLAAHVDNLNEVVKGIREVSHDLTPSFIDTFGLFAGLNAHVSKMNRISESTAEFVNEIPEDLKYSISKIQAINIYRMCLEILNNLLKHAKYKFLSVTTEIDENNLIISFAHDGNTITNEEIERLRISGKGMGLNSIQTRLYLLNGVMEYYGESDVAFIKIKLPLTNENN